MTAMSSEHGTTLGKNLLSQQSSAPFASFARSKEMGSAFEDERTPFGMKVIGKDNRIRPDIGTYFTEKPRPDNAFGRQCLSHKESPGVYSFYRDETLEKTKEKEDKIQEKMETLAGKFGKNVGTYPSSICVGI